MEKGFAGAGREQEVILPPPTTGRFPLRTRRGGARPGRPLRRVTIEVTRRCPLTCPHCYADAGPDRGEGDLELRELLALAFQVRRDFGRDVRIALTGGDPLARADLPVFLRLLGVLGFAPALATNGRLLDASLARRVSPFLSAAFVSLDGPREVHERRRGPGTFRPAVRAARRFIRGRVPRVGVATAVAADNFESLPELAELVRRLDVAEWRVFPVAPAGRGAGFPTRGAELDELRRILPAGEGPPARIGSAASREDGDGAGLAVLADGRVAGCVRCRRPIAGSVRERSLAQIWADGFASDRAFRTCCGGGFSAP